MFVICWRNIYSHEGDLIHCKLIMQTKLYIIDNIMLLSLILWMNYWFLLTGIASFFLTLVYQYSKSIKVHLFHTKWNEKQKQTNIRQSINKSQKKSNGTIEIIIGRRTNSIMTKSTNAKKIKHYTKMSLSGLGYTFLSCFWFKTVHLFYYLSILQKMSARA